MQHKKMMQHKKCLATWYKSDQYCTAANISSANELLPPTIQWTIIIKWQFDHATQYYNTITNKRFLQSKLEEGRAINKPKTSSKQKNTKLASLEHEGELPERPLLSNYLVLWTRCSVAASPAQAPQRHSWTPPAATCKPMQHLQIDLILQKSLYWPVVKLGRRLSCCDCLLCCHVCWWNSHWCYCLLCSQVWWRSCSCFLFCLLWW
jgi:hypothetical protein